MQHANSFRDPEVCKIAYTLSREIYEATESFPKEERYSPTD